MKKIVSLILVVLMTLSVLAGCGGKEKSATTEPVQTTAPVQEDRPLSLGVVEGNTYTSAYAGIGCTLEDGWTIMSAEEVQDMSEIVSDVLKDTDIGAAMEDGQQFYDMIAQSGDMMMNMNIVVQKLSAQERIAYMQLSEEEIVDSILEQKDILAEAYAASGMTLNSMEKATVTIMGEERFAVKSESDAMGIPCYQLQISYYHLGEYSVVLTLTSLLEDDTESMLEMFYAAE